MFSALLPPPCDGKLTIPPAGSQLCAFGGGWVVFVYQIQFGIGKHQSVIPAADYRELQHAGFWQSIVSTDGSMMFLKISIALNLLRLSTNRWYSIALWLTMGMQLVE